jgi:transitional endoplasmic reticulum ATPase
MQFLEKSFGTIQTLGWALVIFKGLASWIIKEPYTFDIFSRQGLAEVSGLGIAVSMLSISGFLHLIGAGIFHSNVFYVLLFSSAMVGVVGAGLAYLLFLATGAAGVYGHAILLSMIGGLALVLWGMMRGTLAADETPKGSRMRVAEPKPGSNQSGTGQYLYPDIARSLTPKIKFKDIHGMTAVKARLKDAAQAVIAPREGGKEKRNGILLFGEPGTGKTFFAEALAGELGVPLLQLSYSDVASQWVGTKTERVKAAFDQARQYQPCVLFIDEVDSFLESRDSGRDDGTKEDRDVVNALLTLMVDIRRCRVLLIAATNHLDRLDAAGIREGRFDFKVEVPLPDAEARIGLLKMGMAKNLPNAKVEDSVIEAVARRWNGFNSKRILAVTQELPYQIELAGKGSNPGFDDFMAALRLLQGRKGDAPEDAKRLDELVLTDSTREMIDLIAGRMADPEHTEAHGGTLPTGVLFYGPPGTGKTATCKALAKSIDWAFLPATGADLARDPKALEKLYAKAKELRPTIVFIDEADELLKNREFSGSTESTNKLLTIMDGVRDRVRDVVWIAATNNPELIDPALLRGGRFTEKVLFEKPGAQRLVEHLRGWLQRRKVQLDAGFTAQDLADLIGDESIANAEAVTQAALNRAVSRRTQPVVVGRADVEQAVRMVLG